MQKHVPISLKGSGWVGKKKAERGQGHGVRTSGLGAIIFTGQGRGSNGYFALLPAIPVAKAILLASARPWSLAAKDLVP